MKLIYISKGMYAKVDDEDYEYLSKMAWHIRKGRNTFYATHKTYPGNETFFMHRVILKLADKKIHVDHIDQDGLNNQKNNLRICSSIDNSKNRKAYGSSKYLGVNWVTRRRKRKDGSIKITNPGWRSEIRVDGKGIFLGIFKTEEDAAKAYDEAAIKYHKDFANLNFKQQTA